VSREQFEIWPALANVMKHAGKKRGTKTMVVTSSDWTTVRKELATKRAALFKRFLENPEDIRLAVEIKHLDDEMLECSGHIENERKRQA
jgi:hypothetical protein